MSGMSVVTGVSNDSVLFAEVHNLFIINCVLYLVVCDLEEPQFWRHFHLYCAQPSAVFHAFHIEALIDPFPLSVYRA